MQDTFFSVLNRTSNCLYSEGVYESVYFRSGRKLNHDELCPYYMNEKQTPNINAFHGRDFFYRYVQNKIFLL